jgi:hypothetical protein
MGQKSIRISWDQYKIIKRIVETIEPLISDHDEIEINEKEIWVKANQQYFIIFLHEE